MVFADRITYGLVVKPIDRVEISSSRGRGHGDASENLIPRTKRNNAPLSQNHRHIQGVQRRNPMRDHDRNALAVAQPDDGFRQSLFALSIEVGVWFVQNYEKRIPIASARQSYSLALPGGKQLAVLADAPRIPPVE